MEIHSDLQQDTNMVSIKAPYNINPRDHVENVAIILDDLALRLLKSLGSIIESIQ